MWQASVFSEAMCLALSRQAGSCLCVSWLLEGEVFTGRGVHAYTHAYMHPNTHTCTNNQVRVCTIPVRNGRHTKLQQNMLPAAASGLTLLCCRERHFICLRIYRYTLYICIYIFIFFLLTILAKNVGSLAYLLEKANFSLNTYFNTTSFGFHMFIFYKPHKNGEEKSNLTRNSHRIQKRTGHIYWWTDIEIWDLNCISEYVCLIVVNQEQAQKCCWKKPEERM